MMLIYLILNRVVSYGQDFIFILGLSRLYLYKYYRLKIHTRNVEKQPKTWYERLKIRKMPMFFGNAKNIYLHIS